MIIIIKKIQSKVETINKMGLTLINVVLHIMSKLIGWFTLKCNFYHMSNIIKHWIIIKLFLFYLTPYSKKNILFYELIDFISIYICS